MNPAVLALNHVLRQQAWARERLVPFAGETLELRAGFLPRLRLAIGPEGLVADAPSEGEASLVITLRPDAPAALARGEEHFLRSVDVSGNARLADAVMVLARQLRWDFEEDLSKILGDVAAHRLAESLRAFGAWQADAGRRLAGALADYVTEEAKLLATRAELEALAGDTARLRDAVERLEQKVRRLG